VTANACRGADPLAIVTSFGTDAVVVCNTRTRTVETTVPVGRAPWGIAWRPTGDRVFVTNREDATVSVIDMATRTVVGTVAVDEQPLGIAVHPFLPRAYVASYKTDKIDVIDTGSLSVVDRIAVGNGPSGVAVHPAGASLYVANYIAGTLSVVDVATGKVTATIATPALPVGVAIHPAGTKVYVACLKGREIAVVGTVSDTLLRTVRVGRAPIGVAFDVAGDRAYVTNSADDTVTVLDAGADKAVAKVQVGHFPLGVAVSSDGTVWVADSRANELALLDAGGTTSGTITVPDTPVAIGSFIGTPPSGCPAPPLPCDDANPFTGDACTVGVGCTQTPIPGVDGVRAGVAAIGTILAQHPDDPIAGDLAPLLPALASAVEAAETGGDRTALRLVRQTLKPVLTALERARRRGTLGVSGAELLDIAREARRELKKLGRRGNTG
jgi:YVTN family beta-propeller protein